MRLAPSIVAALLLPAALGAQERQVLTGSSVSIYNLAGEVRLEPGTGPDVVVDVNRRGPDADKLEVRLRGGQLAIRYPADRIVYGDGRGRGWSSVRVQDDGTFGGGDRMGGRRTEIRTSGYGLEAHADLVVRVPTGKKVQVHLAVGRLDVANVEGDLDIDVYSASVTASGTRGRMMVDAGSGTVRVENARGELEIDTGSGGTELADLDVARLIVDTGSGGVELRNVKAGTMSVDVGSGGVRAERVRADDLRVDTGSGSVRMELDAVPGRADFDTGSGGVTLVLPEGANADLDIDTGSGGITSDFPVTADTFQRRQLRGKIGNGGPLIRVSTGSGGVRLQKR